MNEPGVVSLYVNQQKRYKFESSMHVRSLQCQCINILTEL